MAVNYNTSKTVNLLAILSRDSKEVVLHLLNCVRCVSMSRIGT